MNLPDFFILGETKCGTTSLFNYLIQHPKIIDTKGNHVQYSTEYNTKEIRFFDRFYNKGIDWYSSCFNPTQKGEITGEATPMYLFRTITIPRIKKICGNAKFIILLRDPVARLYSNFNHNIKWVPGYSKKYPDFNTFWNTVHDSDYGIIERGIYYYTLQKWFDQFPRDQFFIERSENLFSNTQDVYSQILFFLGLEDFKLNDFNIYRKNEYQKLDLNLRKEIEEFYAPYNRKLADLLGNEFNWDYR